MSRFWQRKRDGGSRPRPAQRRPWLSRPWIWIPLLLIFWGLQVLLLMPSRGVRRIEIHAGEIALNPINATRSFEVSLPDPNAPARVKEALDHVPRVFVYRNERVSDRRDALGQAFGILRKACINRSSALTQLDAEHRRQLDQIKEARQQADSKAEQEELAQRQQALNEEFKKTVESEKSRLDKEMDDARNLVNSMLGIELETEMFRPLEETCYPEVLEDAAVMVLTGVLDEYIVGYRSLLVRDIDRGIDIYRPGDSTPVHLPDTRQILDRSQAADRVAAGVRELFDGRNDPPFDRRPIQRSLSRLLQEMVIPTISFDETRYRQALRTAEAKVETTVTRTYMKGQNIVSAHQPITREHVLAIEAMQANQVFAIQWQNILGLALLIMAVSVIVYLFAQRHLPSVSLKSRDMVMFCCVLLFEIAIIELSLFIIDGLRDKWPLLTRTAYELALPYAFGAMFIRLFINSATAVVYSVLCSLMVGLLFLSMTVPVPSPLGIVFTIILTLVTSLVGIAWMSHIRRRAAVLQAGLVVAGAQLMLVALFELVRAEPLSWNTSLELAMCTAGGMGSSFLVAALTPFIEWAFGYTTNVKLLELGSLDQPLLKEMVLHAPGTYHHSMVVGNLVEAAAEAIDAEPVLARVAALYHDVGKMKNAEFFAENQIGNANPHHKLKPSMSALILRAHVKDGVRIAGEAGLGYELIDIIEQHQGTTLMRYFYQKALDQCEAGAPAPQEEDFRYVGPKPQTREAALVMLADACEAAVRSLPEKTSARIQGMVRKVILDKFTDGQLDSCNITLKDLTVIEAKFNAILIALHHQRPQYPEGDKKAAPTVPSMPQATIRPNTRRETSEDPVVLTLPPEEGKTAPLPERNPARPETLTSEDYLPQS